MVLKAKGKTCLFYWGFVTPENLGKVGIVAVEQYLVPRLNIPISEGKPQTPNPKQFNIWEIREGVEVTIFFLTLSLSSAKQFQFEDLKRFLLF